MTHFTKLASAAAMLAMLALSGPAHAEGKANSKNKAKVTAKTVKAKAKTDTALPKAKNYDFMADDIEGDRPLPNHDRILGIGNTKHASLIRLRVHFLDQILRSADRL